MTATSTIAAQPAAPEITEEQIAAYRLRETLRLDRGDYTQLPDKWRYAKWFQYGIADAEFAARQQAYYNDPDRNNWPGDTYCEPRLNHFAHVSLTDGAMIAFTENHAKGVADRQTRMKAGKYLKKYYGACLTDAEIRDMATDFAAEFAPASLEFAYTADEIEHVYTCGPSSCMAYGINQYDSPIHPTRVYAGPDLAVAYFARGENDIRARALVWPDRKLYSRIYGDEARLRPLLEAAGYSKGTMRGARIAKHEYHGSWVVPYVDCSPWLCDESDRDYLIIGSGTINARETCGVADRNRYSCDHCGGGLHEDDMYSIEERDGSYCESCHSDLTRLCARSGYSYHRDDMVEMANGEYWHERQFERHGFTCTVTDERHPADESVEMADGDLWSRDAFADGGFVCAGNGGNYSRAVLVVMADGALWSQEHFDEHGHKASDGTNARNADAPDDTVRYRCPDTLELPLPAPRKPGEFMAGDWVECIENSYGGGYTRGKRYQVRAYDPLRRAHSGGCLMTVTDDRGSRSNGFNGNAFRLVDGPHTDYEQRALAAMEAAYYPQAEINRQAHQAMLYGGLRAAHDFISTVEGV
jgi:hypothetical protein